MMMGDDFEHPMNCVWENVIFRFMWFSFLLMLIGVFISHFDYQHVTSSENNSLTYRNYVQANEFNSVIGILHIGSCFELQTPTSPYLIYVSSKPSNYLTNKKDIVSIEKLFLHQKLFWLKICIIKYYFRILIH